MRVGVSVSLAVLLAASVPLAFAQTGSSGAPANAKPVQSTNVQPRFKSINRLSASTQAALQTDGDSNGNAGGNSGKVRSIPHWHGSFTYQNTVYPYIMAGQNRAAQPLSARN